MQLDRNSAIALWHEHNTDETLWRHALGVEAVMRHFAVLKGEDADFWGLVGLLHDIDYEKHPEEHLKYTQEILLGAGYPDSFIHAVESHGFSLCNQVAPEHIMEKILWTTDELTGFIQACALVRPSKSIMDLETASVKKKWKVKSFASGVKRELIEEGARILSMDLDALIQETIMAMRANARELGLTGE